MFNSIILDREAIEILGVIICFGWISSYEDINNSINILENYDLITEHSNNDDRSYFILTKNGQDYIEWLKDNQLITNGQSITEEWMGKYMEIIMVGECLMSIPVEINKK